MTAAEILQLTEADLQKLSLEDLAKLNKVLSQQLKAISEQRTVLLSVHTKKKEDALAAVAVTKLTPEKRASLKRMLELAEQQDKDADAATKETRNALAEAVQKADAEAAKPVPEEPVKDTTKLTDAQKSAIVLGAEVKAAAKK